MEPVDGSDRQTVHLLSHRWSHVGLDLHPKLQRRMPLLPLRKKTSDNEIIMTCGVCPSGVLVVHPSSSSSQSDANSDICS